MCNFVNYDVYIVLVCEWGERFDLKMVGNLFFWDWGSFWWGIIIWCSFYFFLGKRFQVLSYYVEQLDLDMEYNLVFSC